MAYQAINYGTDGTGAVYGFHPGGVNVLFVDGSVHFVKQTIDVRSFAALVTRNGNETGTPSMSVSLEAAMLRRPRSSYDGSSLPMTLVKSAHGFPSSTFEALGSIR